MSDLLTGLSSRHQLNILLLEMAARAKPSRPLTLLLLKLGNLEHCQKHIAPLAMDELMKISADLIKKTAPKSAVAARWNDTVFALLMPNTPLWQAESLAEDMQELAAQSTIPSNYDYQGLSLDLVYGAASSPPAKPSRLTADVEEKLRRGEDRIFAELMLSDPPLPDSTTLNAYTHLVGRYLAAADPYLRRHCQLTTAYAEEIARRLGFSHKKLEDLRIAATLADIAMKESAGSAMMKPGPLTLAEYKRIETHPLLAAKLASSLSLPPHIIETISCHHEKADGSGYPHGLKKEDIPTSAAILGVSGAFTAMILPRPYRPAKRLYFALNDLSNKYWPQHIIEQLKAIC